MNTRLYGVVVIAAAIICMVTSPASAQTADSTVWPLFSTSMRLATVSANVTADSNSIGTGAGFQIASYNSNGQRCNMNSSSSTNGGLWPAAETDTAEGRYVEFIAYPAANRTFSVTKISFNYGGAGSTNAERIKAFYSVDSWKTKTMITPDTALLLPNSTMSPFSAAVNAVVPKAGKIVLRMYPYWVLPGTGSTSKYCVLNTVVISGTTAPAGGTGVEAIAHTLPAAFELRQNYPNPFNPSTEIRFSLKAAGYTTLKVYDLIGNEAATLVDGQLSAGSYTTTFDASRLPSGMYISVLTSNGRSLSSKMVFMK